MKFLMKRSSLHANDWHWICLSHWQTKGQMPFVLSIVRSHSPLCQHSSQITRRESQTGGRQCGRVKKWPGRTASCRMPQGRKKTQLNLPDTSRCLSPLQPTDKQPSVLPVVQERRIQPLPMGQGNVSGHRIIKTEKTTKTIQSKHQPITTMPSKPCHSVVPCSLLLPHHLSSHHPKHHTRLGSHAAVQFSPYKPILHTVSTFLQGDFQQLRDGAVPSSAQLKSFITSFHCNHHFVALCAQQFKDTKNAFHYYSYPNTHSLKTQPQCPCFRKQGRPQHCTKTHITKSVCSTVFKIQFFLNLILTD